MVVGNPDRWRGRIDDDPLLAVAPRGAEEAVLAESRDDVEATRWSVAWESLDDHSIDSWKRSEPTEWVGGVEDSQGPDGRLVDLARSRSARAHALLPAVCLQELQERRVRDRGPPPDLPRPLPLPVEPTRRRLGDDLLDASELGPGPVREPEVALGCGRGRSSGPGTGVVPGPELP